MDKDLIWLRMAKLLPKRLVYFCGIIIGANATTGQYSKQIVPELTFMEALERWSKK
jgi:hypothetical protein